MKPRTNQEWLADLKGPEQEEAIVDLRTSLLRGLHASLGGQIQIERKDLLEDFVQEALLRILSNLDNFRGESKFLTWAHKISIRVAFSEMRRQSWKEKPLWDLLPLADDSDDEYVPAILSDPAPGPERRASQRMMLALVDNLIRESLTDKQRQAMVTILLEDMPLEEVARKMGMNRNAMYKLLHDARQRLSRLLQEKGVSVQDILAVFES